MRGLGETNTERMRRHLKEKAYVIEQKLKEYSQMRELHRVRRKRMQLPVFGIVGYTNAGKSSLLNALTKKGVLAENKLFATLGTNVGKVFLMNDDDSGRGKEILFSDTI
jgi:GTP-binding protein HflX